MMINLTDDQQSFCSVQVPPVVCVWKSSPTLLVELCQLDKQKKRSKSSRGASCGYLAGSDFSDSTNRIELVTRYPHIVLDSSRSLLGDMVREKSRWQRVESLCERSVSFSIFKVPSLLLRDATGGGGGQKVCLGWRSKSFNLTSVDLLFTLHLNEGSDSFTASFKYEGK